MGSLKIKPVILCGGSGTRLWPLSRKSFPKQFVTLINGQSLLGLTIQRVKSLSAPICVTNEEHRFFVQVLLKEASYHPDDSILLEPTGRNTAAAMASAAFMPGVVDSDYYSFYLQISRLKNWLKWLVRLLIIWVESFLIQLNPMALQKTHE